MPYPMYLEMQRQFFMGKYYIFLFLVCFRTENNGWLIIIQPVPHRLLYCIEEKLH